MCDGMISSHCDGTCAFPDPRFAVEQENDDD